ncbi:hypothetical protein K439DRAFT_578180 [Ramaria rubella]|nr:hypothetical protein K439DRAFT_578180 [Ramaria rubella]
MAMSNLLEAAPCFLLLMPGFLPLLFFAQSRIVDSASPAKPAPAICIFVSFLGPLAALSASLGLAVIASKDQNRPLQVAQNIIQSFVEFGYHTSVLYLITPRSFTILASRISLSRRCIHQYSVFFAMILFSTFVMTVIQTSLVPSTIPRAITLALSIFAALFPIPLIAHLAFSAQFARVRRMWGFVFLLQTSSASAVALRIPSGNGYALSSALCTVLWGGGIITLFYTLSSMPLPQLSPPQSLCLRKSSVLPSGPSTPVQVQYEVPHYRQASVALISEDFTALRDPFASPPPVSPISISTPPRLPPPISIPTNTPRIVLSPPPTPLSKYQKPPKPKAREIKPQRRGIIKTPSSVSMAKRGSSWSLMSPLSDSASSLNGRSASGWRASDSGSEDALFLSDEALLSQILLHSLTLEADPSPSASLVHQFLDEQNEASSVSSDSISITTIRTRRDENGRRYASEESRYQDPETFQEGEAPGLARSVDAGPPNTETASESIVAMHEAADIDENKQLLMPTGGETSEAWWDKP